MAAPNRSPICATISSSPQVVNAQQFQRCGIRLAAQSQPVFLLELPQRIRDLRPVDAVRDPHVVAPFVESALDFTNYPSRMTGRGGAPGASKISTTCALGLSEFGRLKADDLTSGKQTDGSRSSASEKPRLREFPRGHQIAPTSAAYCGCGIVKLLIRGQGSRGNGASSK